MPDPQPGEPLTPEQERNFRLATCVGDETCVHSAGVEAWNRIWNTLDATRAALRSAEQERDESRGDHDRMSAKSHAAEQERDALATELRQVRGRLVEVEMERDRSDTSLLEGMRSAQTVIDSRTDQRETLRAENERLRDILRRWRMYFGPASNYTQPVGTLMDDVDRALTLTSGSNAGGNDAQ